MTSDVAAPILGFNNLMQPAFSMCVCVLKLVIFSLSKTKGGRALELLPSTIYFVNCLSGLSVESMQLVDNGKS